MTLSRLAEFEVAFARRQSTRITPVLGGIAVRHKDYPTSQNNNRLIIIDDVETAAVLDAADKELDGLDHRMVTVYGDAKPAEYEAAGYQHIPLVAMTYSGETPPAPTKRVEAVDLATMVPALRRDWRVILPTADEGTVNQLAERVEARLNGADEVRFLAALADDGDVMARVDLYIQDDIAQIEHLATAPEYRGNGAARAVMHEGLRRARAAECGVIFLLAEELNWPRNWYARLGFSVVGQVHEFLRD